MEPGLKSPLSQGSGLVWFITGAGKCHYVRVVGTAPLQRHPTVPIFAAATGHNTELVIWLARSGWLLILVLGPLFHH